MAGSFSQCTTARAAITASTPPPSARADLLRTAFLADVGDVAAGGGRASGRAAVVAAVVVPVVTAVVVRVLLDLGAIQHHSQEPSARLLHTLERMTHAVSWNHLRSDHHDHAVREGAEDERFRHRADGRR